MPATIRVEVQGTTLHAEAWGPGADRALAGAAAYAGVTDDRGAFSPASLLIRDLDRRRPGLRISRSGAVLEALIPAILEQKVTGIEARRAYRGIISRWGEPAPGPCGLRLLPEPAVLAGLPYEAFHPLGVERRRADLIRIVASRANRFEESSTSRWPMPTGASPRCRVSGRGRPRRSRFGRSAIRTRSASATSTCRTWSRSRWLANRAAPMPGCSSCSSRSGASAAASSGSSS